MSSRAIFGRAWVLCALAFVVMFIGEQGGFDSFARGLVAWIDTNLKPLPLIGSLVEFVQASENAKVLTAFGSSVLAALYPALIVAVVLDIALKYNEAQQILTTIKRVFAGEDSKIFSSLTDEVKGKIVRNSLVTTLGADYGAVAYDQIVSSYFTRKLGFRRSFQYHVRFEESLAVQTWKKTALAIANDLRVASADYLWAHQDLSYTRHGFSSAEVQPVLKARFALTHGMLNRLISSELLFFRELLRVPESAQEKILQLDDGQLQELFRDVFQFRAHHPATGKELSARFHWQTDEFGERFIEADIENPSRRLEGSGCRLVFALPHLRSDPEFLVTFATPVEAGAKITVQGSSSMKNLRYIPFLSRFVPNNFEASDATENRIAIDTKVWVFPTSGLMILWNS